MDDEELSESDLDGEDFGSDIEGTRSNVIKIYPKQQLFYELDCGIQGFVGGRGIGKTKIGCIKMIYLARNKQPWMVISPDANVIEDTTWPCFEETAQELGVWIRGVRSPVHRAWIKTFDGGETNILFRGAEKPEKLRGPSKAGVWFDEASIMAREAYLYAIPCLRCMTPQGPKMGPCLMTFTPKGRTHWTFDVFFEPVDAAEASIFGEGQKRTLGLYAPGDYVEIGGSWYKVRDKSSLVTAATTESPFLPPEYFDTLRSQYSTILASQELGGEFVDIQGLMFRREWFKYYDTVPADCLRVRYWDLAGTEAGGDWTVGTLLAKSPDGRFFIEDVVSGQWSAMERDRRMQATADRDAIMFSPEPIIYIEQEGAGAGKAQVHQHIRMLAGHPVYKDLPTRARGTQQKEGQKVPGFAKIVRARPVSAQVEAGNVFLPKTARWSEQPVNDILAMYCGFPETKRWDEIDSLAGAFNRIQERAVANPDSIIAMSGKSRISDKYGQGMGGSLDVPGFFDGMKLRRTHATINFVRHQN
jgi:predicted phage terminase large subunit-like protein